MAFSNSSYQMPPWLRPAAQRLSPTIRTLVVALGVPWLFYILVAPARRLVDAYLVLGPGVMRGQVWQIVTALFVDRNPLAFLNLLGLWFVGAAIERTLGRRRFLIVFFAPGLAANLVIALLSAWWGQWALYSGCGDSVLGLFVGLAVLYGPAQVRVFGTLAMPARALAAIFVGLALISSARNLADLLLSRRVPQVALTSRPARFWNDVFVPSGAPWSSFMESMLLHLLLVVLIVWGQSRVWVSVELFPQRDAIHKSITYYPPTQTFPAVGSRAPRVRVGTRVKQASAHTPARPPCPPPCSGEPSSPPPGPSTWSVPRPSLW